ncbi:MAG: GlsB/YeaQ/YmgE family stress response membrane protein [Acidobacteriota bacterium]
MVLIEIVWTVIIGLIVGLVARLVLPGRDPMGLIMTAILGIAGSFIGKLVATYVLHKPSNSSPGFILSVLGAVILLLLYRLVAKRT